MAHGGLEMGRGGAHIRGMSYDPENGDIYRITETTVLALVAAVLLLIVWYSQT
jgi:hypothetical protein